MTRYLVFKNFASDGVKDTEKLKAHWVPEGEIEAASAAAAIRSLLSENANNTNGEYVAVPARSWQPVKVKVETALKFG